MKSIIRLVGDIGGSHITIGEWLNHEQGGRLGRVIRFEVDSRASKDEILGYWVSAFSTFFSKGEELAISLAIPAPFDYEEGVFWIKEQGKFSSLYGINLRDELKSRMGIQPEQLFFLNDAQAYMLGESLYGSVKGYQRAMGLTLGSGLGSALKLGEEIIDAGLWSSPFKDGIAEDYLGTSWFKSWAKQHINIEIQGLVNILDPKLSKYHHLLFKEYASHLAEFIFDQVEKHDLQAVVISGGIAKAACHFIPLTEKILTEKKCRVELYISNLGEKSILMGASTQFKKSVSQ
jgi:glucokinase